MIETKLNNLEINELTEKQFDSAKESGELNPVALYMTPSAENVSDVLPIIQGGTNAQTAGEARINLGFEYGEEAPTHIPETGDGAIYFKIDNDNNDILPIEEGGTGAVTVEGAVNNLGLGGIGEVISKSERASLSSSGNTTNHCYTVFTEGIWYIGAKCEATISYSTQIIYTLAGCSTGGGTARGTMSSGGGLFSSGIIDATKESRAAYIALYDTNTGQNYSMDISLWAIRIK